MESVVRRNKVNLELNGLRAVLAYAVFIHHFIISLNYHSNGIWVAPQNHFFDKLGSAPVILFFFITGYLFSRPEMYTGIGKKGYRTYLKKRALRIYPAYFVNFLIVIMVAFISTQQRQFNFLEQIKSILSWLVIGLPNGVFADLMNFKYTTIINAGVVWTLRYELVFYIICPWLLRFIYINKNRNFTVAAFIFFIIYALGFQFVQLIYDFSKFYTLGFFGGMVLGLYEQQITSWINKVFMNRKLQVCTLGLGLLISFLSAKFSIGESLGLFVVFMFFIAQVSVLSIFKTKFMQRIGEASYSFYLFHGVVLFLFFSYLPYPTDKFLIILYFLVITIIAWIISIISYNTVERKFYQPKMSMQNKTNRRDN